MPTYRIQTTEAPYHVFSRGNNKDPIFFDERDRLVYLKILRLSKEKFDFKLFAYCLLENHFHLFLQMLKDSKISKLMHFVQLQYVSYFNKKYHRVGHLFQGRFHSLLVQTDLYFQTVERYIHLNPVKAGLVSNPLDYPWSSYRARFQPGQDWVDHQSVLEYYGRSEEQQRTNYRVFTEDGISKPQEWSQAFLLKKLYHGEASWFAKLRDRQSTLVLA